MIFGAVQAIAEGSGFGAPGPLDAWSPVSVAKIDESLVIVLPLQRVESDTYYLVVAAGFCAAKFWDIDISGIQEVTVLNETGQQGWVFEGGGASCDEMLEMPINDVDVFVAGQTQIF